MMRVWHVIQRELIVYFASPMAYAIMAGFLFINGCLFAENFVKYRYAELDWLIFYNRWLLLIIAPILTMRLVSEERRSGTFEMVMTSPVSEMQWVLGKFLGVFLFYAAMILPTVAYIFAFLFFNATGIDYGLLFVAYLGLLLHGALYLAVGVFFSSITSNQVLAALMSLMFLFLMLILPYLFSGQVSYDFMQNVVFVSIGGHEADFRRGIISTRDVLYLLSSTALFLYLSVRIVSWRRWVS
jgi:ABC-2 type transport system permease protein